MGGQLHGLAGASPAMERVFEQVERYADSSVPILILGETGTGKNLCAHAIWQAGDRRTQLVSLNCAAIPDSRAESELFGHQKGAFTGAVRDHRGIIGRANGGTLFLDEITSLSLHTQARLLRCIEEGSYMPVGAEREHRSDFRLLAAAHPDLDRRVRAGAFREDLLHRLGAVRIHLPPLRERPEDVPVLADAFLADFRRRDGRERPRGLTEEAAALLASQTWPGNARQLRNVVEAAATIARDAEVIEATVLLEFLPPPGPRRGRPAGSCRPWRKRCARPPGR